MQGDGDINAATGEDSEPAPIDDDGIEIPPPSHNEVRIAMQQLKNKKAARLDGLPAELFKAGGDEFARSMSSDWNLSALCPALKTADPTINAYYRGISLLPIAYKGLTSILCERLSPTPSH